MANAIERFRMGNRSDGSRTKTVRTLPDGTQETTYSSEPRKQIDATAPHSSRDSMFDLTGIGEIGSAGHGAQWDAFFNKGRSTASRLPVTPTTPTAQYSGGSSLFSPSVPFIPSLAPTTPTDAPAMAKAADQAGLLKSPDKYLQGAIDHTEKWFDAQGKTIPQPSATKSGDSFVNRYGSGSVMSGPAYAQVLSKLANLPNDPWLT